MQKKSGGWRKLNKTEYLKEEKTRNLRAISTPTAAIALGDPMAFSPDY
jgi:hypothetical protein